MGLTKIIAAACFMVAPLCFAQLVQKPDPANNVNLSGQRPTPYVDSHKETALNGALDNMNGEVKSDSLTGTLIGIGAEILGNGLKESLSPESPEAHARELERMRQR